MKSLAWLMLVPGAFAGTPALACKRPYTDAELVRPAVAQSFDGIVVVEVTKLVDEQGRWRAVGQRTQTVEGAPPGETFEFGSGEVVVSSCGPPIAAPQIGQSWVLYLRHKADSWSIEVLYPWDLVSEHDVRLWRTPGPKRNMTVQDLVPTTR